jgi:receptor protein-tyrosine kinase
MSANAEVLQGAGLVGSVAREVAEPRAETLGIVGGWNPENFAREQIRGLVRRVFFADESRSVKQVVFSPVESHGGMRAICDQVGRALALETHSDIAILSRDAEPAVCVGHEGVAIRSWATQLAVNLWRVPELSLCPSGEEIGTGCYWRTRLAELRSEFEYMVIHGPAAGLSSEAALLGQLADGIILVLDAHSTRRATALKIKETLQGASSKILGTVLSERAFPVPEGIYRRL